MLDDEVAQSIRNDEIIRFKVRHELESNSKKGFWKSLNEPFSLWILSTLVVGALTFAYAHLATYVKERGDLKTTLDSLDTQLAARLDFTLEWRKHVSAAERYPELLKFLLHDTESTRIYAEFKDRSTLSLAWEEGRIRKRLGESTPHDAEVLQVIGALGLEEVQLIGPEFAKMSEDGKTKLRTEIDENITKLDKL